MKLNPLFDRVIARPIEEEKQTFSGISLGYVDDSEVKKAEVLAVGDGIYEFGSFIDMKVSVGDIIFYEEHTTAKLFDEGMKLILIKQTDILAYEKIKEKK